MACRKRNVRVTEYRVALICLLLGAGTVGAQTYPAKAIRMVVPIAAGGTSDTLARFVADRLTEAFSSRSSLKTVRAPTA